MQAYIETHTLAATLAAAAKNAPTLPAPRDDEDEEALIPTVPYVGQVAA